MKRQPIILALTLGLFSVTAMVWANDEPTGEPADPQQRQQDAATADEVLEGLLREGRSPIEPTRRPARSGARPDRSIQLDPEILGVAPGDTPPPLRPEGQFIINRRARMVQSSDGMRSILVFEADSPEAVEPPMILLPCRLLEDMERVVEERGDQVVFIVSGQITAYRGVNHLLPTMMREAVDPANLRR